MKAGLRNKVEDKKDYKLGGKRGIFNSIEAPNTDFVVGTFKVKDQKNTDFCSAYATTSASELQEEVELNPDWSFAVGKMISGDVEAWGQDLRTAIKAHTKYGAVEQDDMQYSSKTKDPRYIDNHYSDLFEEAKKHKKKSYFDVEGAFSNTFDDIRSAMWQHKQPVITGAKWRYAWNNNEIIPTQYGDRGFGHAFIFIGQKIIDGTPYLIAHLSNGEQIGNRGQFLFSKEVVNKECHYGNYILKDMLREDVEYFIDHKIKANDSWIKNFWQMFINLFK